MNRRQFVGSLGLGIIALGLNRQGLSFAADSPQVAITLDDFNWFDTPKMTAEARNRALLDALRAHSTQAAMFVCAKFVDNEKGQKLLSAWDEGGHLIGNHSYSHMHYPSVGFEKFSADVLKGEAVIKQHPRFRKIFRFPYLKEGDTVQQRDMMRAFLKARGYRNGHVTIDASDWYVNDRMSAALKKNPDADLTPYRDFYLEHIWERSLYYDDLSRKVMGRSVRHTLLLHHNVLNGLFLGDLMSMFKTKGWRVIKAEDAYRDPVFSAAPNIAPAGESLIWALAKETGKFEKLLRYPGEDGDYEKERMDKLGL
ncbi:MAG: peptidoglycan-N-acetylglucosamine deacetylase [Blastocatellia bacterium]|jgi:peptidoglycan/xylan/chitin deacetylase (PgdA/CDA1 family)|nr:peptidoglycan-N-acetylglucosamine deacetylase [Blastocatellia bacterium]